MHAKRLLALAEFLEKLPRKRFSYHQVVGENWKGAADLSCGTVGCAMGWAPSVPALKRAGLRMVPQTRQDGTLRAVFVCGERELLSYTIAAMYLFDISYDEADGLFTPEYWAAWGTKKDENGRNISPPRNATPKAVARHIRRFIAWKEKQT